MKKKKFRLRNNQTAPYAESPMSSESFEQSDLTRADTPRSQLPPLKLTRSPQLSRLREDSAPEDGGLSLLSLIL